MTNSVNLSITDVHRLVVSALVGQGFSSDVEPISNADSRLNNPIKWKFAVYTAVYLGLISAKTRA